jgi:hypothetical protein
MKQDTVRRTSNKIRLPRSVRQLFWEYHKHSISWLEDRDLIIKKILQHGSWDALCWMRSAMDDEALRSWLIDHDGAGLEAKRLRYWQLILNLPKSRVDAWIQSGRENPWNRRTE